MKVEMVKIEDIKPSEWAATYILRPDLLVLSVSIADNGILSPLLVRRGTGEIIDGHQRFYLASQNHHIREKINGVLPVTYIDCGALQAMILHVQMNRARGSIVAKRLSQIVRKLSFSKAVSTAEFDRLFCMKHDELELLLEGTLVKMRKIHQHTYSRAWVPIEVPAAELGSVVIERPPNDDR